MSRNVRNTNGHRRRQLRARVLSVYDHCGICGGLVDKKLKTPHPLSPEVDEIIPVSRGGNPLDFNNVQLAHRICNQRKSDKIPLRALGLEAPKMNTKATPIENSREW